MRIKHCNLTEEECRNKRLAKAVRRIRTLVDELNGKPIPDPVVAGVNREIEKINVCFGTDKQVVKVIERSYVKILDLVKKESGIVTKDYYKNQWLAIGMGGIGVPIGVVLMALTKNPVFLALGLPLGFPIGYWIGQKKDQQARRDNKQLSIILD